MPKILVIDDDTEVGSLISRVLKMEGHTVVEAEDGIEGVAKHRVELPPVWAPLNAVVETTDTLPGPLT